MGGALLGSVLAAVPGVAWANDCRPYGRRCTGDRQCCSRNCIRNPSGEGRICGCPTGQARCGDRCVNLQRNERHCGSYFNRCREGSECVGGVCQGGGCPRGTTLCGGQCVTSLCSGGQAFNPSTCQCAPCPPGTTICTSGEVPGLNVCCPLEGHIACCTQGVSGPTGQPSGEIDAHTIGCVNSSCPGGCVIRATDPGDLLGANAGVCSNECNPCVTDSGGFGCLSGSGPDPVQCVPR